MSELRQALDAYAAGKLDLGSVERELTLALARQPHLAAAHGALIEALYRSGRIKGEPYLTLTQVIRAFQQRQPRVNVQVDPPPAGAGADDKTQFRAPRPSSPASEPTGNTNATGPGADAEKTQFRAPRVATSPPATGAVPTPAPPPVPGHRPPTDSRIPTGSRPTNSSWTDLGRSVAEGASLSTGSIVKDRF